jgi:puromycin-sensitive aminopeptidase
LSPPADIACLQDEPAAKATFAITLVCPADMIALSNMPIKASTPVAALVEGGAARTKHEYDVTPIMSTYLVAFVIGKFDQIEATTADGTLVRCFATPGKGEQNRFALDLAVRLLPYYNDWFDVKYPLPKLDMVAVPDFAARR